MIDERNAIVTPHVGADDTVISHGLIHCYIAQVAQNKLLNNVLVNLFSAEGSEVYLNPASDDLKLERGSRKGHSVIGFRRVDGDPEIEDALKGGIYLNPPKCVPISLTGTISSLCWRSMICPVCRFARLDFSSRRSDSRPPHDPPRRYRSGRGELAPLSEKN